MVALIVASGPFSSVSLYLTVLVALGVGFAFAPTSVRWDKRVWVAVALLIVVAVLGARTDAVYSTICQYRPWALECWLF